jgi:hypothetical protein
MRDVIRPHRLFVSVGDHCCFELLSQRIFNYTDDRVDFRTHLGGAIVVVSGRAKR